MLNKARDLLFMGSKWFNFFIMPVQKQAQIKIPLFGITSNRKLFVFLYTCIVPMIGNFFYPNTFIIIIGTVYKVWLLIVDRIDE